MAVTRRWKQVDAVSEQLELQGNFARQALLDAKRTGTGRMAVAKGYIVDFILGLAWLGELSGLKSVYKHKERTNAFALPRNAERLWAAAACGGHLEVLVWLQRENFPRGDTAAPLQHAALAGHQHVLEWLLDQGWDLGSSYQDGCCMCAVAALAGHLAVLQWLRAAGCPWDSTTCCAAAQGGHLKILHWAASQGCEW